jgi:hypothetical protein
MGSSLLSALRSATPVTDSAFWATLYSLGAITAVLYYALIIRDNHRTKSCNMPLVGICAIEIQCLIAGTFGPWWRPDLFPHNPYVDSAYQVVWVWRIWLTLQSVILYQFFKYHDSTTSLWERVLPGVSARWMAVLLLIANLVGQWSFIVHFHDFNVNESDPVAYLFLAVGFVVLALNRPGHEGLSFPVAWMKLLSTTIIYITPFVHPLNSSFATLLAQPDFKAQMGFLETCKSRDARGTPSDSCPPMQAVCWSDLVISGTLNGFLEKPIFEPKTIDYDNCVAPRGPRLDAGDFAGKLIKRQKALENMGWRITGFTTVYHARYGEYELVRTNKPLPPTAPLRVFKRRGDKMEMGNSWGRVWYCLTHNAEPLDQPVWELQPVDSTVFSCVDGTIRMKYQFPAIASATCVGFDALYVYLLWKGRRRRRASMTGGASVNAMTT